MESVEVTAETGGWWWGGGLRSLTPAGYLRNSLDNRSQQIRHGAGRRMSAGRHGVSKNKNSPKEQSNNRTVGINDAVQVDGPMSTLETTGPRRRRRRRRQWPEGKKTSDLSNKLHVHYVRGEQSCTIIPSSRWSNCSGRLSCDVHSAT